MSAEIAREDLKRSASPDKKETEEDTNAQHTEAELDGEDDGWIGPLPSEQSAAVPAKKKKGKNKLKHVTINIKLHIFI